LEPQGVALIRVVSVSLVAALACVATARGEEGWCPPRVEEGLAQQMAERMGKIGMGADDQGRLQGARQMMRQVHQQVDKLGVKGLLALTPEFSRLSLPKPDQPSLDAMGRLSLCNLVLLRQHMQGEKLDQNRQVTAVLGLSAVTAAELRLRHQLIADGGDPNQVEAFLTGGKMAAAFSQVQEQEALLSHVEEQCTPVVHKLLEFLGSD
jgi:hypothetical protein